MEKNNYFLLGTGIILLGASLILVSSEIKDNESCYKFLRRLGGIIVIFGIIIITKC